MEHARADALRAMRVVRAHAADFGIDPQRIGIMGWSAGGELAALVSYGSSEGNDGSPDAVERVSAKPDFQVLVYPGPAGIPNQVARSAPPTLFVAASDDPMATECILELATKHHAAGVPWEAHLYARGGHGFNMGQRSSQKGLATWSDRLRDWMADGGFLRQK
jgi:acetyl esterase/lipase